MSAAWKDLQRAKLTGNTLRNPIDTSMSVMDENAPRMEQIGHLIEAADMASNLFPALGGAKLLALGALKGLGKKTVQSALREAPQAEAMRLAQQRAALPVEQHGLGLPPDNTPQMRADAMGAVDHYHGSLYDIKKPSMSKASTEAHAGQGFYSTVSPKDASLNYANIHGPDVVGKVEREFENIVDGNYDGREFRRIQDRLRNGTLTPRQQEIVLANTVGADNLGVVYPLKVMSEKPLHLDRPQAREADVGPFQKHDPAYDDYVELPAAEDLGRALRDYESRGGDPSRIHDVISDHYGDTIPAERLYRAAQKGSGGNMYDDDGNMISEGVAAADFVKELGIDQISHTPQFRNPQLNIGGEHTISMNPDNVRSRFAAFDPWRRNAAIAAATGTLAPDLLAEELRKPQP